MRSLVTSPDEISARQYQRFIQSAQTRATFPDGLVRGEPYLALNALVITRRDFDLLHNLTATFARCFYQAACQMAADVPALIEVGFPWVAAELLAAERPRMPLVGRFDFVQDSDGQWWLLEFNSDTPSGVREGIVVDRLAWQALAPGRSLVRPNRRFAPALAAAFRDALRGLPSGSNLGLVTTASELEDLAQMAFTRALLQPALDAQGISVILGDLDNLRASRNGLELLGRPLDALYRYVPFEGLLGSPAFAAICEAAARGHPRVLNGLFGLLLQNKGLLAWLWAHRSDELFTAAEQAAIESHLPPTWMIGDAPDVISNARRGSTSVIKQVFGREGEEVYFSEDLTAAELDRLQRLRSYVSQRKIDVAPTRAILPTALGHEAVDGRASIGSFAVDGRWAGFYSRIGGKVINSRAKWVATFVEGGDGADASER
ncbi:MAG: hypothetical protein A3F84_16820 [Candidatus Handelsmanbacteria bacterium RIFCSPLOWO2_12_FULL_64_10]|uniref:Glutathionylspermidine synthase pre-ATP-grasp-like domain-containing protein n=1 Tax=Handelsmanbacteria sp. (strain RIFCSPLOWO2_12_FULL_64_10) TaxID=1817868 RepID=A0A1F6CKV1_HANXR|nr:MAG: hypothetical protein A3F84_16820 [Candidatus Handelsmanbacteria bacterium RIFCSPLOWO2_12_FULL_64_10]